MADPYVGEIRMFAGSFAPLDWLLCEGQTLAISEYETLFTLIGTSYGGDGVQTFKIPDLRGRLPVHLGSGLGQNYVLGQAFGTESVTLSLAQVPQHTHVLSASSAAATSVNPANALPATGNGQELYLADSPNVQLAPTTLASSGSGQPHENRQPSLCLNFIISLFGIYPTQA